MKFLELIDLIGLQSTDPKLVAWFEENNLGKLPKTITSNQGNKTFNDKINSVSYQFKYDIKHPDYYPPVSPKNNNYTFNVFLSTIIVFSNYRRNKKKFEDPKPLSFWEGFVNPKSSFEECLTYFDYKVHESVSDGDLLQYYFEKKLGDFAVVSVFYAADKSGIKEIDLELFENSETFGYIDFKTDNQYNTVKPAYTFAVKWLFDNDYLIKNESFPKSLSYNHNDILNFVNTHLHNHVWDTQIKEIPLLYRFLLNIGSNTTIKKPDGSDANIFIKYMFIKASGKWEEWEAKYNVENRDWELLDQFESNIQLNELQAKNYFQILNESFEMYKAYINSQKNQ